MHTVEHHTMQQNSRVRTNEMFGLLQLTDTKGHTLQCILAGCPDGGIVLDPFSGSGTTGVVALNNNKKYIGIELNPEFAELSHQRIKDQVPNTLMEHLSE